MAFDAAASDLQEEQRDDLERVIAGWAALPMATGSTDNSLRWPAIHFAARLGDQLAAYRIRSAIAEGARRMQHLVDAEREATETGGARNGHSQIHISALRVILRAATSSCGDRTHGRRRDQQP
jgi:hypothetical protein